VFKAQQNMKGTEYMIYKEYTWTFPRLWHLRI